MADVAFICPQCGHAYEFASHLAGKRGRCKVCRTVFRIPAPAPRPSEAPASPPKRQAPPAPALGSASPAPGRPADEDKIVFNCPNCGHGYRLAGKLAGKQGRCTACRGVFTIPARSRPPAPAAAPWSRPAPPRGAAATRPAAAPPTAGDSGWWELDSSESLPVHAARAGAGRSRAAAAASTPLAARIAAMKWTTFDGPGADGKEPIPPGKPPRPKWVTYAAIAAGVAIGGIAYAITYSLVSGAFGPGSPPVADQPGTEPSPAAPPAPLAKAPAPSPGVRPQSITPADQHREAVDALIRAYNDIADGYARIRDADSIPDGQGLISRGVEQLKSAAQRGRGLPPLSPADRAALNRGNGPTLIQAVDRVLGELRRLKATPGLRSDFDRLIEAYTRVRRDIQREIERR